MQIPEREYIPLHASNVKPPTCGGSLRIDYAENQFGDCICGMSNYSKGLPNEIRMPKPDPLGPNGPFAIIGSPVGAGGLILVIFLFLFLVIPLCADK